MDKNRKKIEKRRRRSSRIRSKINGSSLKPRLNVFKSNRFLYIQIIDDSKGCTLVSASNRDLVKKVNNNNIQTAFDIGKIIAKKALEKKIKQVVFDRNGYKYHGKIKSLADGARDGGLNF